MCTMCWCLFIAKHNQGQSLLTRGSAERYWLDASVAIVLCLPTLKAPSVRAPPHYIRLDIL